MASPDGQVSFGKVDYVFLVLMLAVSMVIGLYFALKGNKKRTQEEYLLGGREMSALPVCLSLFATFQSAISILGIPTEIYTHGTMFIYSIIGFACSYLLALMTVVPLTYPLQLTTVFEYLNIRYQSSSVQLFGAALGILTTLAYMMVALFSPALALETSLGVPLWLSIILVGAVGTIYTTLGGMKSVIYTDVFQTVIIFVGVIIILIKGAMDSGGFAKVWQVNKEEGRTIFDDTRIDPRVRLTVWNQLICVPLSWLASHFSQSCVQRILSTKSLREAKKVFFFTIPVTLLFSLILVATGLVILAYFFTARCDPLAAGYVKNRNQIVPYFVLHTMGFLPGFCGLYIATIFAGALSTLSSGITSLATNTVEDFLPRRLRYMSEFWVTTFTKMLVCFYGMVAVGLAYAAKDFKGPVIQMTYTVTGASGGTALGIFLLGGIFPQANYIGALTGGFTSLILSFSQAIGAFRFGHHAPALPLGPTDHCPAQNTTVVLKSRYTFGVNGTTHLYNSSWILNTTTAYPQNGNVDTVNAPDFLDRDFSINDISYVWNPLIGILITMSIGLIVSLISNRYLHNKPPTEARLLFPFCRRFWNSDTTDTQIEGIEMEPSEKHRED